MGVTTTLILTGLSAVGTVVGGMQQQAAGKQQANAALASSMMQGQEQARIAAAQANQESKEADAARRLQKIQYLKSGVDLEGSPLLMMESTRLQGEKNIDEIITSGAYGVAATAAEGRVNAANYKQSGRSAFIDSLSSAAGTIGSMEFPSEK